MSHSEVLSEPAADEASKAYVQIRGVTKKFDEIAAVDDVTLNIRKGEIFGIRTWTCRV